MLDLLLLGHDLLVEQVDSLFGYGLLVVLSLFPGARCLSSNVVKGFFAVCAKFGVFEFPCLCSVLNTRPDFRGGVPTFCPYGDCPFSSLFRRTLWKSYLFSWRTKLAKLLCLNCSGSMVLVNFSHYSRVSGSRRVFWHTKPRAHYPPQRPRNSLLHRPSVR